MRKMNRKFVDFSIKPKNIFEAEKMIEKAAFLNYKYIGIVLNKEINKENFSKIREYSLKNGIDAFTKIEIEAYNKKEILNFLRKNRREFEIISIICKTKEAALLASRDGRVDTYIISLKNDLIIDKGVASISKNIIEIQAKEIINHGKDLFKIIKNLMKILEISKNYSIPLIFSSGAENIYEQRSPIILKSFLTSFEYSEEEALKCISDNPLNKLMENRLKLSNKIIISGVRIIKEKNKHQNHLKES